MADLAVIGAGVGGCSAAYFARKFLPNVNVTIYDAQDRVGGRILTRNASGASLELGAAFFNRFNKTIMNIVRTEGLKFEPMKEHADFAVWNGSEIVFRSSKQSTTTYLRLFAKYKISLIQTFLLIRKARRQIAKLYREEQKNPADICSLFESAGLDEWHKRAFAEVLLENGVSQNFIEEVVEPITRTIYTQNAGLGGFAGITSLLGVYSGETYSLAEGNSVLPSHLAEASNAKVKLGQKVDRIEKKNDDSYSVHTGEDEKVFDDVIIATPLEVAEIKFDGISWPSWEPQCYQPVYRRVMRGVFNPNYFRLKESAKLPAVVLTTKEAHPLTQFSIQKTYDGESLVTVSSAEPISDEVFDGFFKKGGVTVLKHYWKAAYPIFKPVTKLPPTRIDERLMYASALEPSVSSMETSALSALNAVRMLNKELH
jgi:prenylcysteine oxidase/farnesylcysteine lyase